MKMAELASFQGGQHYHSTLLSCSLPNSPTLAPPVRSKARNSLGFRRTRYNLTIVFEKDYDISDFEGSISCMIRVRELLSEQPY